MADSLKAVCCVLLTIQHFGQNMDVPHGTEYGEFYSIASDKVAPPIVPGHGTKRSSIFAKKKISKEVLSTTCFLVTERELIA